MTAPDRPALNDHGPVVIVGAGQAGALLAIYLARQGHDVTVYESRPDLRRVDIDAGRSINLALATRGIVPLVDVGVIEQVDAITIPMKGRMIHAIDDPTPDLQPYGTKPHEVIHSVSRSDLNAILLDAAEATGRVTLNFDMPLEDIDFDGSLLRFENGTDAPFGVVFGADGAGSRVRRAILAAGPDRRADTEWLDHDYKELTLPPAADGGFRLDPNALHIWPRGEFMLIALANPEGDFTVTLFAPKTDFDELTSRTAVDGFFAEHFGDFAAMVPDLAEQFFDNPTGPLGTMRATGWSHRDRAVIVGDAAHAIVPFHGQGMNLAMESVRALDRHLRDSPMDIGAAFRSFEAERKPNADAIADMALDNYIEMRAGVLDPDYLAKRQLALELEQRHPDHLSPRYNMVMFSTMPYAEAKARSVRQAELLTDLLARDVAPENAGLEVLALAPLPDLDPLADPKALSIE
ncbi:MAG: NAD(P)/FAD-dependent oxidoreductase [Actinomycetota bacterium]